MKTTLNKVCYKVFGLVTLVSLLSFQDPGNKNFKQMSTFAEVPEGPGLAPQSPGQAERIIPGKALFSNAGTNAGDSIVSDDPGNTPEMNETVLFPFDDYSIPITYGLSYNLVQGSRQGVVLRPGSSGPDSRAVMRHGSIIRIDGEFRMWYLAAGDQDAKHDSENQEATIHRVCYAVSQDGIKWERPALGLVNYGGNTKNNLVDFPVGEYRITNFIIIHDLEDPDPGRRFKMAFQSPKYKNCLAVAFSPDGLHWKEFSHNPVNKHFYEISGLIKFNGCYYVNGHGGSPRPGPNGLMPRRMITTMSYDFENWTDATALSFERHGGEIPNPWWGNAGEQVHVGASLWNRGNVIIGFYGMWHGHPSDDRRLVTMDLGLVVSNDAIHFKEPIPDFKIIGAQEEGETETHTYNPRLGGSGGGSLFGLALYQGQGWENVGNKTLYWYSVWSQGRVRLATWPRDRLGYFEVARDVQTRKFDKILMSPHFVSYPIKLDGSDQKVFINADGLSKNSYLKVEICDEQFRKIPGYLTDDCVPITESGFRQPVEWLNKKTLAKSDKPIRVRVSFEGESPEKIHVYAVYVSKN